MGKSQRVSQEFYCGECNGYFMVRLNMALNHEVYMECPNCEHQHRRLIKDGVLYEQGRFSTDVKEDVLTTMSTYHKKPITDRLKEARAWRDRRDGVKMSNEQLSRWAEVAHRERTGEMSDD